MKQFFTLALAFAAAASVNVNAEGVRQGYVLSKIEEPTFAEFKDYTWDAEKLQVTRLDVEGEDMFYRVFTYDEEGRTTEEAEYQFFYFDNSDEGDYSHVNSCITEYDDQGRLSLFWVVNYNPFISPDEPYSVAVMAYTYNEKGLVANVETSFCNTVGAPQSEWRPAQRTIYEYNDQDQNIRRLHDIMPYGETEYTRSAVQVYTYDGKGRLVVIRDEEASGIVYSYKVFVYDGDRLDNVFLTGSTFRYEIDANGDLKINKDGNPTKLQEFVYEDEIPAENVLYPTMSVYDRMVGDNTMDLLSGMVIMETVYERPQEDGATLEVYSELEYTWDLVQNDKFPEYNGSGIQTVAAPTNFFRASVKDNELVVKGNPSEVVRIYDLNGRLMQTSVTLNGKINVSDLESGVYVVTSGAAAAKVIR